MVTRAARPAERKNMIYQAAAWQRRAALIACFVLTFVISWAIEIPLALSAQGLVAVRVPFALHYLAFFGPLFAALVVTLSAEGSPGIGKLFAGLTKWRVGRVYAVLALIFPTALFALAVILSRILHGVDGRIRVLHLALQRHPGPPAHGRSVPRPVRLLLGVASGCDRTWCSLNHGDGPLGGAGFQGVRPSEPCSG